MIDLAERITLMDSLMITVFSMAVVFAVLAGIALFIKLLRAASNGVVEKEVKNKIQENIKVEMANETIEEKEDIEDEELVAVISAAIAASLGVSIPEINIRSIRRTDLATNSWAQAGRVEQIMSRL